MITCNICFCVEIRKICEYHLLSGALFYYKKLMAINGVLFCSIIRVLFHSI